MRKKVDILLVLITAFMLVGCNKAPIDAEKMEDILFDIYRTDACVSVEMRSMQAEQRVKLYNSIFEKHGVAKQEFDVALDWYAHHPKDLEMIYGNLVERTDDFAKRVEDYEFSPKEKHNARSSIDSIELWMAKTSLQWRAEDGEIDRRQTDYTLDDRKFFMGAQQVRFHMNLRCWSKNEDDSVTTMMVLRYSKGANDTLRYKAPVDSAEKIYTFTKNIPKSKSVSMVRVQVMDTVKELKGFNMSNVSLIYIYDSKEYKMPGLQKNRLFEMRRDLRGEFGGPHPMPMVLTKDGKKRPRLQVSKK